VVTSRFRHIYLTGFMGAGKSTVGRALAQRLGWAFVDLDSKIESRCRMPIPRIFTERGEEWFRQQEHEALEAIPGSADTVVAVGGGALQRPDNRRLMRRRGITVWLDVPFSLILQRLGDDGRLTRPLFTDQEAARALFEERRPQYARADRVIQIRAQRQPDDLARDIETLIGKPSCAI
jgi:shikimate kinase